MIASVIVTEIQLSSVFSIARGTGSHINLFQGLALSSWLSYGISQVLTGLVHKVEW
jgi:hypothetical protein